MEVLPDWIIVGEVNGEMVYSGLPWGVLGSGYFAVPLEHVESAVRVDKGLCHEPEGMVTPPVFPFLFEPVDDKFVYFSLFLHWQLV